MGNLFEVSELTQVLEQRTKTKDKKQFVRLSALVMLDRGFTHEEISVALGINPSTLSNWKKEYETGGVKAVISDHYKPFQGYLSEEQLELLTNYVDSAACYTCKQVASWIEEEFGLDYTESGVSAILHRLGFTYKRISLAGHKTDPEKQEQFIEEFESLMDSLEENDKVYFTDGVHPSHNVRIHYQWIKKGERREVPCNTGRGRVNIIGALNAQEVTEVEVLECDSVNTDSTIALLEKVKASNPLGTKYFVCDNAKYYRSKKLKEWLTDNQDVVLVFLPAYSPNLNVIERLWKHMKKKVCVKFFEKFTGFREAIMDYFKNIGNYKEELESLLTLKFKIQQKPVRI